MMLATSTLPLFSLPKTPKTNHSHSHRHLILSRGPHQPNARLPKHPSTSCTTLTRSLVCLAYVSGPASDPIILSDDELESTDMVQQPPTTTPAITWGLLWALLLPHKLRLLACLVSLVGCSSCTLSMPIFSGRFFEVLIGARPEPLWVLLSKVGVLYALEPIFTVMFVVNMNTIWENVMSSLRARIFSSILIRKVEFFDRYKVGELTALLTSDLGSLKSIVSDNISRDRGFRALSEVTGTICLLFVLAPQLAPILAVLMLVVSVLVGNFFITLYCALC